MVERLSIIGGSGPLGRGLACRLVLAGLDVTIGSRRRERAIEAAGKVQAKLADVTSADVLGTVDGERNDAALDADAVIITLPSGALEDTLPDLAVGLAGRIVVSTVNPLAFDDGPYPVRLPAGSGAETIARLLPDSRVTAAFHTVSSRHLLRVDEPMDDHVPVVGDDEDAVAAVVALVDRIPGLRALVAGPLRLAAPLEDLTSVLLTINQTYACQAGLGFSRLPPELQTDDPRD